MRVQEIRDGCTLFTCATFGGVSEVAGYSERIAPHAPRSTRDSAAGAWYADHVSGAASMSDWLGCSIEAARERLIEGWPKGVEQAQGLAARLERLAEDFSPVDVRRRPRWSEEAGDEFDGERMRAGAPWWRDTVRARTAQSRAVTLCVQIGGLGDVSEERLRWNAVLALALVSLFEGAGISCAVRAVAAASQKRGEALVRILDVKRADEILAPDIVAAMLAPSTFRACLIPSSALLALNPCSGGGATYTTTSLPRAVLDYLADGAPLIVLPQVLTEEQAVRAAERVLRVHAEPEALAS